jgi:voltage-gated potassium channel Kch
MPANEGQVAWFAESFRQETGKSPSRFVCPITLADDPTADLCDAHIVCNGIKVANRATVPQRKDVDNAFGTLFEGDFVRFVNIPKLSAEELLRGGKRLVITSPNGEKMPTFFSRSEIVGRQRLDMYDDEGVVVAQPFLKDHVLESGRYRQLEVEFTYLFQKHSFTAAMLKTAYLTLFKIFGYGWVLDSCGDRIRRALVACLDSSDRRSALSHFEPYEGCARITFNAAMSQQCGTLEDGSALFHYAEGDLKSGFLFAITCLYWLNDKLVAVTIPSYQRTGYHFVACQYYEKFIRQQGSAHNAHFGRIHDGRIEIAAQPLSLGYTTIFPPTPESSSPISPAV